MLNDFDDFDKLVKLTEMKVDEDQNFLRKKLEFLKAEIAVRLENDELMSRSINDAIDDVNRATARLKESTTIQDTLNEVKHNCLT